MDIESGYPKVMITLLFECTTKTKSEKASMRALRASLRLDWFRIDVVYDQSTDRSTAVRGCDAEECCLNRRV